MTEACLHGNGYALLHCQQSEKRWNHILSLLAFFIFVTPWYTIMAKMKNKWSQFGSPSSRPLVCVTAQASVPCFGEEGRCLGGVARWTQQHFSLERDGSSASVPLCGVSPQCSWPGFVVACVPFSRSTAWVQGPLVQPQAWCGGESRIIGFKTRDTKVPEHLKATLSQFTWHRGLGQAIYFLEWSWMIPI